MIKLSQAERPATLDDDVTRALTDEYKRTKKSVWNRLDVKRTLQESSNHKCAYCEMSLGVESKYVEVEHFRCKRDFEDLVVFWDNLLPSCKLCNGSKSDHNVDVDGMIINPYHDDPKNHLYFQNYRLKGKTALGIETIKVVDLNNPDRLTKIRYEIGTALHEAFEDLNDDLLKIEQPISVRTQNKYRRQMTRLLKQCVPPEAYAACCATVLVGDQDFASAKASMIQLGLWDHSHDQLHTQALSIAMPQPER